LATLAQGDEAGPASQPALIGPGTAASAPAATQPAVGDANPKLHAAVDKASKVEPFTKGPPLPFHTIEGYGGGAITPMAYLVDPPRKGEWFGLPSAAFSNVMAGSKNLQALTLTENLFGRIELGYGLDRLGLGSLPHDIKHATGVDIERDDVWLNNFNLRGLFVEENSFGQKWIPAITGGIHFKINSGVGSINDRLGGALSSIGYDEPWGIDYTLTASKTIVEKWTFNRPLIVSAGLRNSDAAYLGFLGFGGKRSTTFEGNVAYMPTDWLLVAYEFRQNPHQFGSIPGLVGPQDNWNAIDVSWIINKNMTLVAGWGAFGTMVNSTENGAWWLQFKYEF
jgi:hypothetical protein